MSFRIVLAVPVIALLVVLGVWYADSEVVDPSPIGAADDASAYIEGEVVSIDRWDPEPGAGTWYYEQGFDEIYVRVESSSWLDFDSDRVYLRDTAGTEMLRLPYGYVDIGGRYGFFVSPTAINDPVPMWVRYSHDLDADQPGRGFDEAESSNGQTAADVLACLVAASPRLETTAMFEMVDAVVETNELGERAPVLADCENAG